MNGGIYQIRNIINNKGKVVSQETRQKIGNGNRGKKHTEAQIEKQRQVMIGENNPNYGRIWSDETNKKRSVTLKGHPNFRSPYYKKKNV